jgi:hypothetical protein
VGGGGGRGCILDTFVVACVYIIQSNIGLCVPAKVSFICRFRLLKLYEYV